VRRIAHELSFGLVSTLRILALPRADVYVVVSPPLALGFFAWIATTLKRSRFVFHVQDLQPDAAVGLGMLRAGWLVRALYGLERLAYAKAAAVAGISAGMMAAFRRKGVPTAKRVLLPNWLHLAPASAPAGPDRAGARRQFGVADGTLLAVYAGNLGRKQSLEILIEAAFLLQARPPAGAARVKLIVAGDGAARPALEQALRSHPGVDVELRPLLGDADYAALLRAADVALITQAVGTGQVFFPSKLLTVLAAGLPVVAVADKDSELTRAVAAGGFGCAVQPGDAIGLAAVLRSLGESRAQLGAWAAHTDWVRQFSRESILPRFEHLLLSVAGRVVMRPVEEPETTVPAVVAIRETVAAN
jgi:colanic acid biosynthesis glycosyl transferase WcaI